MGDCRGADEGVALNESAGPFLEKEPKRFLRFEDLNTESQSYIVFGLCPRIGIPIFGDHRHPTQGVNDLVAAPLPSHHHQLIDVA